MKINRSANAYVELPLELCDRNGTKEAKASISMNITVPSGFERKMQKFMATQADAFAKAFRKAVRKEIDRQFYEEGE